MSLNADKVSIFADKVPARRAWIEVELSWGNLQVVGDCGP
jgi:hypothetical protein